jgi:hypothetical protein
MIVARRVLLLAIACHATGSVADAQSRAPLPTGEVTVSVGVAVAGGYAIGDRIAELRRSSGTDTLPLFRAESSINPAPGLDLRVGYALAPWLAVEASGSISHRRVTVSVSGDVEAQAPVEITERISEYLVGGRGVVFWPGGSGGRWRPYVVGGLEYLRQLHEDRLLVETGQVAFAGGGVRYWLRGTAGRRRTLGLRGELGLAVRRGGIDFEERRRRFARASLLGVVGF